MEKRIHTSYDEEGKFWRAALFVDAIMYLGYGTTEEEAIRDAYKTLFK